MAMSHIPRTTTIASRPWGCCARWLSAKQARNSPAGNGEESGMDNASASVEERYFIHLAQGGQACAHLPKARLSKRRHAVFFGGSLNFRSWTTVDYHLADTIGKI